MKDWFTIDKVDESTYIISEYRHWEETHCYLLIGGERALLIDTGLGVGDIRREVEKLSDKPVIAVATHAHWDHIGGHKYFPAFLAHSAELGWLNGEFPIPTSEVRRMLSQRCHLPNDFDIEQYDIFRGRPYRVLSDREVIDLGGRRITALHTPGHSPGHLCFWEEERGYLFSGDLVYKGTLLADFPSTEPREYLASLEKLSRLPVKRVFPGHHSMDISPELLPRMRDAFSRLNADGKLRHGSGFYDFGDWALSL